MFKVARLVLVVALLALALTGCRQQYDAAARWLDDQPGVASVEDLGNLTPILPVAYEGTIRGHLEPGLSDQRILELAGSAADYLTATDSDSNLTFELADGEFIFLVDRGDAVLNESHLAALRRYDTDPAVTGAYVSSQFTRLLAERRDLVDLYFRHVDDDGPGHLDDDLHLIAADAENDATASISAAGTPQCEQVGRAQFAEFVKRLLYETDLRVVTNPCTQILVSATRDEFVDTTFALRDRWEEAGSQEGFNLVLSADTTQTAANFEHYGDELEVEVTGPSREFLELVRVVDTEEFGDADLTLHRRFVRISDGDRTVCELLDVLRGRPGFDQAEILTVSQRVSGDGDVEARGPRAQIVSYIDAHTPASGPRECTAEGTFEVDE